MEIEILKLKERIEIAVEVGESYYCEFKSAFEGRPDDKAPRELKEICYDIAKTLVAFANADGGILIVGVEDNRKVTGLPFSDSKLDAILSAPERFVMADTPLPLRKKAIVEYLPGIHVAFFSVDKGSRFVHVTSRGECFQRKDDSSVPTAPDNIKFAREEEASRAYDKQFVELANVTDLEISLVAKVAAQLSIKMTAEKLLQYLELAEFDGVMSLKLRRSALLLFAKNVNKWHPRCHVRILKVRGTEEMTGQDFNVTEVAEISANIFNLYEDTWNALRPHLAETRFSKDAIFKTQIIYPEDACREALINAIVHRDYSMEGRGIEIRIFDDRLEILSPGKILSSISLEAIEQLEGLHETRNTYIARVLREYGYIRELGEGIRRIYKAMSDHELAPPQISSPNKSFVVKLFHREIYNKEQKAWLEHFAEFGLTKNQKSVVCLGMNGRLLSRQVITDNLSIVDTDDFRKIIDSLQKLGILATEVPDAKAMAIARKSNIKKKDVPRFKVVPPFEASAALFATKTHPASNTDASMNAATAPQRSMSKRVHVKNVPSSISEAELENLFSTFGKVQKTTLFWDRSLGTAYGYVYFEDIVSANKARNKQKIDSNGLSIKIS